VAQTPVWVPPGRWVDYFTGATFTGPSTATLSDPLSRMPVFVRAGGIVPEQSSTSGSSASPHSLSVKVVAGAAGTFSLYEDAGSGLGYTKGQHTETVITTSTGSVVGGHTSPTTRVTIGPARGSYPGEATSVAYDVQMIDLSRPTGVTLDGKALAERTSAGTGPGWSYQPATDTVSVTTGPSPTDRAVTVVESGGGAVARPEPAG
jgi:hypothetical protein